MSKQLELDKKYLRMAKVWAENSYAIRKQVGCLIVKDKMIISDGYNGTPSGFPNVCEYISIDEKSFHKRREYDTVEELKEHYELEKSKYPNYDLLEKLPFSKYPKISLVTKPEVLHAEANAITKLAKSGNSSEGATLYVTYEPCLGCSKLIIQAGIKRVVYYESYREHDGVDLLLKAGVEVEQIDIE